MNNKKITFALFFLILIFSFFSFIDEAKAAPCSCRVCSLSNLYCTLPATVTGPTDAACGNACNSYCIGQGQNSYFFDGPGGTGWEPTDSTFAATPCPATTSSNVPTASGNNFTYIPMEQIPGQPDAPATDFYTYVGYLYKFGIAAVGIAALFMITVGGFMYITSAGNNAKMESAKGVITDAIVGLILALSAYLILYTINPELVNIRPIRSLPPTSPATTTPPATTPQTTTTTPQTTTTAGLATNPNNLVCNYSGVNHSTLNVCSPLTRSSCGTASQCNQFLPAIQTYASGAASVNLLKAFLVIESDCGQRLVSFDNSSFGPMMIRPGGAVTNAQALAACGITSFVDRNWLISPANFSASICLAARYINSLASSCGSSPAQLYAGYNGGVGGLGSCGASVDCASDQSCFGGAMQRWECPFDSGKTTCNTGYQQTRQGAGYINYCMTHLGF